MNHYVHMYIATYICVYTHKYKGHEHLHVLDYLHTYVPLSVASCSVGI